MTTFKGHSHRCGDKQWMEEGWVEEDWIPLKQIQTNWLFWEGVGDGPEGLTNPVAWKSTDSFPAHQNHQTPNRQAQWLYQS